MDSADSLENKMVAFQDCINSYQLLLEPLRTFSEIFCRIFRNLSKQPYGRKSCVKTTAYWVWPGRSPLRSQRNIITPSSALMCKPRKKPVRSRLQAEHKMIFFIVPLYGSQSNKSPVFNVSLCTVILVLIAR